MNSHRIIDDDEDVDEVPKSWRPPRLSHRAISRGSSNVQHQQDTELLEAPAEASDVDGIADDVDEVPKSQRPPLLSHRSLRYADDEGRR